MEDHPLPAVHDYLFNTFSATLHLEAVYSIHNPRTCQATKMHGKIKT
jgi:hypothetical protein